MNPELVSKAFLLGLIMASPIGPVGLLCLKKNTTNDRWRGLASAFGMAIAYAIISFCVVCGLRSVSGVLETYRCPLEIIAGVALIVMGWRGMRGKETGERGQTSPMTYFRDFLSSFGMTLFNPVPFATFAVMMTTMKIFQGQINLYMDIKLSLLIMAGTLTFWLVVNQMLHLVRKASTWDLCRLISKGAAVTLILFGAAMITAGLKDFAEANHTVAKYHSKF